MNRGEALERLRGTVADGGPIAEPEDARYVSYHTTGVAGFFGASSMEGLPTEIAPTENMRRFRRITRHQAAAG